MHFCKVCNKGFSCGGALGGHMRSHGFEDINAYRNNDEDNKHTYFLRTTTNEEKDLTNYLVMLSAREEEEKAKEGVKGNFQCKACKKVFNSHQALGGHRASHKRVRGCFAARFENIDDGDDDDGDDDNGFSDLKSSEAFLLIDLNRTSESSKKKQKVHECSICHRVFSSGQALGGHKRCHWLVSNMRPDNYRVPIFHGFPWNSERLFKKPMICKSQSLDLNLPTLFDNRDHDDDEPSKFTRIYLPAARDKEETCREVELPKLREMNLDGKCSTWLQVGIGHPTE